MSEHIDKTFKACARLLYRLRTLRAHEMTSQALHTVFQCTVHITYAVLAWWGFTNVCDKDRLHGSTNPPNNQIGILPSARTHLRIHLCQSRPTNLHQNLLWQNRSTPSDPFTQGYDNLCNAPAWWSLSTADEYQQSWRKQLYVECYTIVYNVCINNLLQIVFNYLACKSPNLCTWKPHFN